MDTKYICEARKLGTCMGKEEDLICGHDIPHTWKDSTSFSSCESGNCGRIEKKVRCIPIQAEWDE